MCINAKEQVLFSSDDPDAWRVRVRDHILELLPAWVCGQAPLVFVVVTHATAELHERTGDMRALVSTVVRPLRVRLGETFICDESTLPQVCEAVLSRARSWLAHTRRRVAPLAWKAAQLADPAPPIADDA